MPFILAYVIGFFFSAVSLSVRGAVCLVFVFVFLSTSFSMKLNYFPNFKLLLFGRGKRLFRVKNVSPFPKKNLIQVLVFEL